MSQVAHRAESDPRVLVVEDEPQICELLSDMLRAEGFDPQCAQRDEEAYAALHASAAFGGMIVDVNLGTGTTGYDVARFARRIDPQLPVIFVSGQSSPESFRANSVPGALFLPKPFTAAELMERVRMVVGDNDG